MGTETAEASSVVSAAADLGAQLSAGVAAVVSSGMQGAAKGASGGGGGRRSWRLKETSHALSRIFASLQAPNSTAVNTRAHGAATEGMRSPRPR